MSQADYWVIATPIVTLVRPTSIWSLQVFWCDALQVWNTDMYNEIPKNTWTVKTIKGTQPIALPKAASLSYCNGPLHATLRG